MCKKNRWCGYVCGYVVEGGMGQGTVCGTMEVMTQCDRNRWCGYVWEEQGIWIQKEEKEGTAMDVTLLISSGSCKFLSLDGE